MYLGLPDVAVRFKDLEKKCLQIDNHYSLSNEIDELMQMVDKSWLQIKDEMEYLRKAV
jgi:predicted transcriptional regulator